VQDEEIPEIPERVKTPVELLSSERVLLLEHEYYRYLALNNGDRDLLEPIQERNRAITERLVDLRVQYGQLYYRLRTETRELKKRLNNLRENNSPDEIIEECRQNLQAKIVEKKSASRQANEANNEINKQLQFNDRVDNELARASTSRFQRIINENKIKIVDSPIICDICYEKSEKEAKFQCNHGMCPNCAEKHVKRANSPICHMCRSYI
jgi:hypothetical protein